MLGICYGMQVGYFMIVSTAKTYAKLQPGKEKRGKNCYHGEGGVSPFVTDFFGGFSPINMRVHIWLDEFCVGNPLFYYRFPMNMQFQSLFLSSNSLYDS